MPKPHYRLTDKPPTYYYMRKNRAIICQTLRAASTSMLKTLTGLPRVSPEKAIELREQGVDSIMWLRDPLERWAGAAHLFMRNRGWILEQFHRQSLLEINNHWHPQTHVHTNRAGILVPNIVYPFEVLNETWPLHARGFLLGTWNVTKQRKRWPELAKELSFMQIKALECYYARDIELREKVCADYNIAT